MIRLWFWAWSSGVVTAPESTNPQWAYKMQGRKTRTFAPRVRNEAWVQPGDLRHSSETLDTWEGEAT